MRKHVAVGFPCMNNYEVQDCEFPLSSRATEECLPSAFITSWSLTLPGHLSEPGIESSRSKAMDPGSATRPLNKTQQKQLYPGSSPRVSFPKAAAGHLTSPV
ncbi:unnamed protein product [Caretta caretta]